MNHFARGKASFSLWWYLGHIKDTRIKLLASILGIYMEIFLYRFLTIPDVKVIMNKSGNWTSHDFFRPLELSKIIFLMCTQQYLQNGIWFNIVFQCSILSKVGINTIVGTIVELESDYPVWLSGRLDRIWSKLTHCPSPTGTSDSGQSIDNTRISNMNLIVSIMYIATRRYQYLPISQTADAKNPFLGISAYMDHGEHVVASLM